MEIWQSFVIDLQSASYLEYVAVFAGIVSVWFSKKENVLVYPVGLVNTIIYIYISIKGSLFGEATVNVYYTIMAIYGWYKWVQKDGSHTPALRITYTSRNEWFHQFLFFSFFYVAFYVALQLLKQQFYPGVIPWADAFASAAAFTGMWLMTRKKIESWYWWMATNITAIPLYFVKHYVLTSVYYFILLLLAIAGLREWQKKIHVQSSNHRH